VNKVIAKALELIETFPTARFIGDAQKRRAGNVQILETPQLRGCI